MERAKLMKELKLTILIEAGKKSELMNVFGTEFVTFSNRLKFMQYSFPDVKVLTQFKIAPILQLLESFEHTHGKLKYKSLSLFSDKDLTYSPVYFECSNDMWSAIKADNAVTIKSSSNLLNLL